MCSHHENLFLIKLQSIKYWTIDIEICIVLKSGGKDWNQNTDYFLNIYDANDCIIPVSDHKTDIIAIRYVCNRITNRLSQLKLIYYLRTNNYQ